MTKKCALEATFFAHFFLHNLTMLRINFSFRPTRRVKIISEVSEANSTENEIELRAALAVRETKKKDLQ